MDKLIEEEFSEDVYIVAEEETIGEGENAKKQICFKGIFSEADTLNRNKRVYPKSVLREVYEKAVADSKASGKPIFGELEHASDAKINLERICVTFPELTWNEEKGQIVGKAVPTLTDAGKTVVGLAKSGFPICFSTRMAGKVRALTEARKRELNIVEDCVEVMPGARLISIDVVGQNSCQKAVSNTVYEQEEIKPEPKNTKTVKTVFDAMFN